MSNAKKRKNLEIYHRNPHIRGIMVSNTEVDEKFIENNQEKE